MSEQELTANRLSVAIEADETIPTTRTARNEKILRKHNAILDEFLGKGKRYSQVFIPPRCYGELLSWALKRHIQESRWEIFFEFGHRAGPEPVYFNVETGPDTTENLMEDGQMVICRDDTTLILTVTISPSWQNTLNVEGLAEDKNEIDKFIGSVVKIMHARNFYRGAKFVFSDSMSFLDMPHDLWKDVVISEKIKDQIRNNSIRFLKQRTRLRKLGIPFRRGILLAGQPGVGKTMILRALMSESKGITCIVTSAYRMNEDNYILDLYEMAKDLAPSMILVEDIDQIAASRDEYGNRGNAALVGFLTTMDRIGDEAGVVTMATTNSLEALDKAISNRPSRFDLVLRIESPGLPERKEIISRLCKKIHLDESAQNYLAQKTDSFTPAQLQEVVFSLAINSPAKNDNLVFTNDEIESAINLVNHKNRRVIGFSQPENRYGLAKTYQNQH